MKFLALVFSFFVISITWSQGTVRGVIKDALTKETIPLAKVKVEGVSAGANADFSGEFLLKIAAGEYKLIFSMSVEVHCDPNLLYREKDGEKIFLEGNLRKKPPSHSLTV